MISASTFQSYDEAPVNFYEINCIRDNHPIQGCYCEDGYWSYDHRYTNDDGTYQIYTLCTKVNDVVCPDIRKSKSDLTFFNPKSITQWYEINNTSVDIDVVNRYKNYNQTPVSCSYSLDDFQTFGDIMIYQNTFIGLSSAYEVERATATLNDDIFPYFCSLPSLDCPLDPLKPGENVTQTTCSRFTSLDPEGDLCRSWAAQFPDKADQIKVQYCHQPSNIDRSECACINKAYSPLYRAFKKDVNAPDSCWYTPCANGSLFLQTSSELAVPECPDVCGLIINNIGNAETIDLSDADIYIDCVKGEDLPMNAATTTTIQVQTDLPVSQRQVPLFIFPYTLPWEYWFLVGIISLLGIIFVILFFLIK